MTTATRLSFGSSLVQCECSWTDFKSIMTSKDLAIQYARLGDVYHVFCIDTQIVYSAFIYAVESEQCPAGNADALVEFESVYQALANKPLASSRADGVQRVQLEPADATKRAQVKGFKLAPSLPNPATETVKASYVDVSWDATVAFQGLHGIHVSGHEERDYIKLSAVLPIGTTYDVWGALGLGPWPFGAAMSTMVDIELFVFGVDIHLPTDGHIESIVAESSFAFPSAVRLRFTYYAHGASAPRMVGLTRVWI